MLKNTLKRYLPDNVVAQIRKGQRLIGRGPAEDWHMHLSRLIERDLLPALPKDKAGLNQRILFWTPMANWPQMLVEYFIAWSLRLRGWEAVHAVCDGYLPHCEMERANFPRPTCESCWRDGEHMLRAVLLPHRRLSEFVSRSEIDALTVKLNGLGYQELIEFNEDGYEAGAFARRYLVTYFQGLVKQVGAMELSVLRRVVAGNILAYRYAERLLQHYRPDVVVTLNGNSPQFQPGYNVFRGAGIRVITWEDYGIYQDGFIFSNDEPAVFSEVQPTVWEKVRATPLAPDQQRAVDRNLTDWARGKVMDIVYHPSPVDSIAEIRQKHSIDPAKKLFVAFTNIVWDSAALGRDVGFKDMMDWLHTLCDWFASHTESCQLVVRIHPAEKRLPKQYETTTGVEALLRNKYPDGLPENIILIGPEDDTFSYTLAEIADGIGVYTSSLGYELAARSRRVWVAGKVHYRDKGFVLPIEDADHLRSLLSRDLWDSWHDSERVELARKYIYFRFFRQIVRIPFLKREMTVYRHRPYFRNLDFLLPGRDPLFSTLVNKIVSGEPIIDVPWETTAQWHDRQL